MKVDKFISEKAKEIIEFLNNGGVLDGGHNGPYYDKETPIRVSAHWIIILSYLYKKTNENKYYDAIKTLAIYLKNEHNNGYNNAYLCRNKEGKDKINGTIGQAWAIEGLIEAAKVLKDESYYDIAKKVFCQQKFDEKVGIWNRVEVDGRVLGFDVTYNHQLWFAAAGAQIVKYKFDFEIDRQINIFLDKSKKLLVIRKDGLIFHFANISTPFKEFLRNKKRQVTEMIRDFKSKPSHRYKELGYHCFNIYGFALIYEIYNKHEFFKSTKFKRALDLALCDNFIEKLEKNEAYLDITGVAKKYKSDCNIYSFGYNSPAFELPYIKKIFKGSVEDGFIDKMWEKQMQYTYDLMVKALKKNTEDSVILTARLYELVRAL